MVVVAAVVCAYALGTTSTRVILKKPQVSANQMGHYLAGKVSKKDSNSGKSKKTETVYVELKSDGQVSKTTVSDMITVKGNDSIVDESILKNIKNIKGNEKYSNEDGKLVWENKGKDITYQGTTDQAPPISVSISYALNGKDISAEDLEGKSGELQIQYRFKNNARTKGHDFVPFVVLGGFIFDDETFSNVQIDNGKVADYDESKIVLGYAVPGLDSHLQSVFKGAEEYLNKISLPDAFTISADVKDCTMSMGLLIATSSIGDFNIKDSIDLSNLKSKINELQNGADTLVDGANQLSSGSSKLASASTKVKKGTNSLTSGLKKIKKGAKKNHKGNKKFHKALNSGLDSAKSGAKKLADGSDALAKGAKSVDDGVKKIDKGATDLNSGSKKVSGGIDQVVNGFEKKDGINDGAKAIKNGTKSANGGVKQLVEMLQSTPSSIEKQIDGVLAQVKQASGGAISTEAQLNGLIEGINSAVKSGTPLETVLQAQGLDANTYYSLVQAYYSIQTLENVKSSLSSQISSHKDEISALTKGMQSLEDGSSALAAGLNTAYVGLSSLSKGASTLNQGTTTLKNGTSELSKGTGSLKDGANTLNSGVTELYSGVKVMKVKIGKNSPKLTSASSKLYKAIETAHSGSKTLSNGMVTFCNGMDTLNSGTKSLKDGANTLNEKGIKKITSIFGDKADGVIDDIQDLLDAGNSYNSFSGISKDMNGQVKFIYKTPEIGEME